MRRTAGGVAIVTGLGFGVPGIPGIGHLARTGEVWSFLGFPTYGGGPFEHVGLNTTIPLLGGFLVVCCTEVMLGV